MLESWASPDMQDTFPPCLTAALQTSLKDGVARADAANRAVQDLQQQVQQLEGRVEEGTKCQAAQASQLNGVQQELSNTKQQLKVHAPTSQANTVSFLDIWTCLKWCLMEHCAEYLSAVLLGRSV